MIWVSIRMASVSLLPRSPIVLCTFARAAGCIVSEKKASLQVKRPIKTILLWLQVIFFVVAGNQPLPGTRLLSEDVAHDGVRCSTTWYAAIQLVRLDEAGVMAGERTTGFDNVCAVQQISCRAAENWFVSGYDP